MIKQNALTLVTPVIPGKHDELNDTLMQIRAELSSGKFKEFEKINTLHYARFVLLEDKLSTAKTNLVFSSDYDGDESEHLMLLVQQCTDLIDKLYSCCEGYPATGQRTAENRVAYLKKWQNKNSAFYIGAPGRSLQQIKQENRLRNYLWDYLRKGKWEGKSAKEVHNIVRSHIASLPEFSWTNERVTLPKSRKNTIIVVLAILAIVLFPLTILIAIIAGLWLLVLHFTLEKKDKPLGMTPSQIDDKFITNLEGYEDFHNQNQFTQIIPMKPGIMRLITINLVLLYGKFRIKNEFLEGELMGIPTIHFARWVMLDNNKQVLFFSNFDGSWQQYLGDFIDKSGWGLTGIFSNTENFPNTRYLFWGGAYDEEHFLAWSRYYQIPTQVWYCAYPKLSIKNINTNSLIRTELIKDLDEHQAQTFLNRF